MIFFKFAQKNFRHPLGIFSFCPGWMEEPRKPFAFWMAEIVTPGYYFEMV